MSLEERKVELTTQLNEDYDIDDINPQSSEPYNILLHQFYQLKFLHTLARYGSNLEDVIKNMPSMTVDMLLDDKNETIKREIEDIDNELLLIICDLKRASSVKSKEILAEVVNNTYYYDSNSSKILFYLYDQQLGSVPKEFLIEHHHNNDIFLLPTSYEFDLPDDIPCMTKQHLKFRILQDHKKSVHEELKKLRRYIDYPLYGKSIEPVITNNNKQSNETIKTTSNSSISINDDNESANKSFNRKLTGKEQQQSQEIINNNNNTSQLPTNEEKNNSNTSHIGNDDDYVENVELDRSSDSALSYDEIEENSKQLNKKQSTNKNDNSNDDDNFDDFNENDLIEYASDLEEYISDSDKSLSPLEGDIEEKDKSNKSNNNNDIQPTKRLYSEMYNGEMKNNGNNQISDPLKKRFVTPPQDSELSQQQEERIPVPPLPSFPQEPLSLSSPANPNEQQQQQQQQQQQEQLVVNNKRIRKINRKLLSDEDNSGEDSKEEDYLEYEDDLNDEDYNIESTYDKKTKKRKTPTKKQSKNDKEIIDIKEEEVVGEEKFNYGSLRQYLISANIPMFSPRDKLNIRYIPIIFTTPTISLNVSSST